MKNSRMGRVYIGEVCRPSKENKVQADIMVQGGEYYEREDCYREEIQGSAH